MQSYFIVLPTELKNLIDIYCEGYSIKKMLISILCKTIPLEYKTEDYIWSYLFKNVYAVTTTKSNIQRLKNDNRFRVDKSVKYSFC